MAQRAHEPWLGCWDVPGGFCEVEEHPIQTATRELREETGLGIEVTGFLGIWLDDYPEPDGNGESTLTAYYHALVVGGQEEADPNEVSALAWFPPDGLPHDLAFQGHLPVVLQAWRQAFQRGETVTVLADRPA